MWEEMSKVSTKRILEWDLGGEMDGKLDGGSYFLSLPFYDVDNQLGFRLILPST